MAAKITFGEPVEQESFTDSHPLFFERFPKLQTAMEVAFIREATTSALPDMVVFFLGRLSVEDFMEILLLCGNGRGTGAMKLLRGMYERVVTARHLHAHPEEVRDFLDFYWINAYKVAQAIKNVFGDGQLSAAKMAELGVETRGSRCSIYGTGLQEMRHAAPQLHLEQARLCFNGARDRFNG